MGPKFLIISIVFYVQESH